MESGDTPTLPIYLHLGLEAAVSMYTVYCPRSLGSLSPSSNRFLLRQDFDLCNLKNGRLQFSVVLGLRWPSDQYMYHYVPPAWELHWSIQVVAKYTCQPSIEARAARGVAVVGVAPSTTGWHKKAAQAIIKGFGSDPESDCMVRRSLSRRYRGCLASWQVCILTVTKKELQCGLTVRCPIQNPFAQSCTLRVGSPYSLCS